jgi:hypothetical protein
MSTEADTPRSPYFEPRRLGATAPGDCRVWSLDTQDGGPEATPDPGQPLRRLEDPDLLPQLTLLLNAGLRVIP